MPFCMRCKVELENHQCRNWLMVEKVDDNLIDTVRLVEFHNFNNGRAVSCRIHPPGRESRHLGLCDRCRINKEE